MLRTIAAALLMMGMVAAHAADGGETFIRKAMQARFPEIQVESVTKMPFNNLYEVVVGGRILYTDDKVSYIFFGTLLDTRSGNDRDLTRERTAQLAAQVLRKSTDNAIKRVRGNGKRTIYTFEDPNCPYCKELQKELHKLNDVTIYTFLWPILSPDSVEKSRGIWCSRDRAKAWDDWMLRGVVPPSGAKCDTPLDKNIELAQRFGSRGTPAVFLADGNTVGGYVPADKLEQALSAIK
ncbi:MAG TPA: DsbC family protein [Burkholderiales bacterium]|nr:DsbC family protein [Burkholderiales bacterium]